MVDDGNSMTENEIVFDLGESYRCIQQLLSTFLTYCL
jgi:hypothetical protein